MDPQRRRRAEVIRRLITVGWSPPPPNDKQVERMLEDIAGARGTLGSLQLTMMEERVLALTARGLQRREVADRLSVSSETVKEYLTTIYRKLGARNAAHAVALAFREGILR